MDSVEPLLGLTRRQLLRLAGAAGTVAIAPFVAGCDEKTRERIRNRPMRRSIGTLGVDDPVIKTWERAIDAMRKLPAGDRRNYEEQVKIHGRRPRHGTWLFLPWHRAYLFYFEEICRELTQDESFAIPYWNWTAHLEVPAAFRVQGSPLYHAGRRSVPMDERFVGQVNVDLILSETNFKVFASNPVPLNDTSQSFDPNDQGPLEGGPHNHVHCRVGGDLCNPPVAPRDPIFWAHHARIDELWMEWNIQRGNPNTSESAWIDTTFNDFVDRKGQPVVSSVLSTVFMPYFTYRYDTQGMS